MNFGELLMASQMDGGIDDPKKKKKEHWAAQEMRVHAKQNLPYDNKPTAEVFRNIGKQTGLDPALLWASAEQEGLNKLFTEPDIVSDAYVQAEERGEMTGEFPVDAFRTYGIDQFDKYLPGVQKDLPQGFDQRYKIYKAKNEHGDPINTVAFRTNEDALLVKALILKNAIKDVDAYAAKRGVKLDDQSRNYLALAKYNSRSENFPIMFDELSKAKDRNKFITEGQTSRKGVHPNIYPRIENMAVANELLNPPPPPIQQPIIQ